MSLEETFILAPGVGCSRLGAELVLLDQSGQMLRGLNAEGARVLSLLNGRRSVREVCQLCGDASATEKFLSELSARGLLVEATFEVAPSTTAFVADLMAPAAIVWEQRFVGLQVLSDPCSQTPPPGFCQGQASRFGDGT